jgi:hypothetical protein
MSEAEAAAWIREKGGKVVAHDSRQWERVRPGFYQPVHVLGALDESAVSVPTLACWGYRAVVRGGSRTGGRLITYLVDDVANYDEGALASKRRNKLRRAQRSALRLVTLEDAALLESEGYEVCLSACTRYGFTTLPTPEQFSQRLRALAVGERSHGLAAMLDGRLIAYILLHVIEGTAYGEHFYTHSSALRTEVSTLLVYEVLQLLRQSGVATRSFNGFVNLEADGLDSFKTSMGFAHTSFPARVHLRPGATALLRRWLPERYERLTGYQSKGPGRSIA